MLASNYFNSTTKLTTADSMKTSLPGNRRFLTKIH